MRKPSSRLGESGVEPPHSKSAAGVALVSEEILLREAGERTEMHAAEMRDLRGFPAVKAVALRHRLDDPHVDGKRFEPAGAILPSMREPTIATLHGDAGFAVKVAVRRSELPRLIPLVKNAGGSDIAISTLTQIVP